MADSKDEVKLLSAWPSPFAMRALYALEVSGIPYEVIEQDLANKSQLLLESNPVHKKVPVLLHNGKPVCESAIIVEYIDAAWNKGWLPKDAYARAQARFWGDFVDNKLAKAGIGLLSSQEGANEEYQNACSLMEEHLLSKLDESKPFVGGDQPNYVDIMLAYQAVWVLALADFGLELPSKEQCPRFHRLLEALRQHPAAKKAFPDLEKLKAQYRWFVNRKFQY